MENHGKNITSKTNNVKMEIPRHWRLNKQRYNLVGFKIVHKDKTIEYEFPPKASPKILYDSSLLLSPNNEVVHSVVVGEYQEQDDKS